MARLAGLAIDPGTRGPAVDTALQTSAPLVFAAGNLVHAARHMAVALGGQLPPTAVVGVTVTPPLSWISPNAIRPATPPPRGRFVLRCCAFQRLARIEVRQDGRLLARSRPSALIPGRPVHLAGGWISQVDPAGGPVRVALAAGTRTRGTMGS